MKKIRILTLKLFSRKNAVEMLKIGNLKFSVLYSRFKKQTLLMAPQWHFSRKQSLVASTMNLQSTPKKKVKLRKTQNNQNRSVNKHYF